MQRRVVITGVGAVSGFGVGLGSLWDGLCAGRTAIGPITRLDASGFRSSLAA
jgi:3-oxoacyl-(acyl-carrier-protein) synthase